MLTVWFVLLIIGWAMIYQPVLGTAIRASSGGVTDTSWATAIYYSGFLITTLGTGDVVPKTGLYRLLAILETVPGFVTISMVITYFLSVYSSLATRNAFAQGLHHATANTDDAAQLLVMLADGADLPDARSQLGATTPSLRQIFQTHRSYPVQALQIPWPPPGNFHGRHRAAKCLRAVSRGRCHPPGAAARHARPGHTPSSRPARPACTSRYTCSAAPARAPAAPGHRPSTQPAPPAAPPPWSYPSGDCLPHPQTTSGQS